MGAGPGNRGSRSKAKPGKQLEGEWTVDVTGITVLSRSGESEWRSLVAWMVTRE
jgi:hypothetical protein